jgi:hypothetical protein
MYANGKVYAIICRKTERRYIGSTCELTLAKRLAQHVNDFKNWKKEKGYFSSFDIIKDGDYQIILLELYPCNSKDELRMCEQKHIDACECINKNKAFQSKEEKIESMKQYNQEHKEEKKEYYQEYYIKNCDKIKEQQNQYHNKNRDEMLKKMKEYSNQRVCCPNCQKEMNKSSLLRHKKICVKT